MEQLKFKPGEGRTWTKTEAIAVIQEFRDIVNNIPNIQGKPVQINQTIDRLGELDKIIREMKDQGIQ